MQRRIRNMMGWGSVCLAVWPACGLTMRIDYTYDTTNFFGVGSQARATMEAAAGFYSDVLMDTLAGITPSGGNTWTQTFTRPDTGASTSVVNPTILPDEFVVFVGARELGGSTLGLAGPGAFSVSGSSGWVNTVVHRGEGVTTGAGATDFARWGGQSAFDITTNWHRGLTTLPTGSQSDLLSVALHELGHVLGVGLADSWDNLIAGTSFNGPKSVAANGGVAPQVTADFGHWANGTQSCLCCTNVMQETAMDPSIFIGTRKLMTKLDLAGLDDLGWEVASPGDFNQNGSLDAADIDLLATQRAASGYRLAYDLNHDRVLDAADLSVWLTEAGTTLGDVDLDGDVDVFDANALRLNFTGRQTGGGVRSWSLGNFDGDGDTDFADAMTLRTAFAFSEPELAGIGLSSEALGTLDIDGWFDAVESAVAWHASVPEPAGLMVVGVGLGLIAGSRRGARGNA